MKLTLEEMETCINISGADRTLWDIYSDDPVMQKKLERAGAELVRSSPNGQGKYYTMRVEQIRFTKPISDKQREARKENLRKQPNA